MSAKYFNFLDMLLNNSDWSSDWNHNLLLLGDLFRTFKMTITVQGDHTTPSTVTIQLQDATGTINIAEQFFMRVRVVDNNGFAPAIHATIAAGSGTTLIEAITANKDIVFQSNSSGVLTLTCTDTTIEAFQLLLGQTCLSPQFANYNNYQVVVHA